MSFNRILNFHICNSYSLWLISLKRIVVSLGISNGNLHFLVVT